MKELSGKDKNMLFSPLSVAITMGMVLVGAEGDTSRQLKKAMHVTSVADNKVFEQMKLAASSVKVLF